MQRVTVERKTTKQQKQNSSVSICDPSTAVLSMVEQHHHNKHTPTNIQFGDFFWTVSKKQMFYIAWVSIKYRQLTESS